MGKKTENLDHSVDAISPFLLESSKDASVWLIEGGIRRYVSDGTTHRDLRKRFGPTVVKSHQEIMQYPQGPNIPSVQPQVVRDKRGRTYLTTNESKAEIKDPRIVDYLSDGKEPLTITLEKLANRSDLPSISSDIAESVIHSPFYLVQGIDGEEVYLLKGTFIRWIPNPTVLETLTERLQLAHIQKIPDEDLESEYIEGPAIPHLPDHNNSIQSLQKWSRSDRSGITQSPHKDTSTSYAVIVGIAAYQRLRTLSKTTTDAQDLHRLLTQSGYPSPNLALLLDEQATKAAISDRLDWLARSAGPEGTVLVFFSGHGAQRIGGFEPGEYLCPVEADWYNLRATAISDEEFTTALRAIQAGRVAVFLDACHSGGVGEPKDAALQVKAGLSEAAYARLAQGRGRAVVASCRPDEVSWELPGMRNGLFTHYLLEGLRGKAADPDGTVGILDLFKYVSQHVPQHKPQHPLFKGEIELNFSITGRMKPSTPPGAAAPAPVEPVASPKREIDPGNVNPTKLRQAMHSAYDRPAFEILCKDLDLDYHDLRGETLETKMLYLVDWHQRRRRYAQLVRKVLEDHPYLREELQ